MKTRCILFLVALGLLAGAGCGTIDVTPGGNPDRTLTGVVNAGTGLPAGAEISVRLLAPPLRDEPARPAGADMPVVNRPTAAPVERVLGEHTQTLSAATAEPVPFSLQYFAEDALLRRGLTVEARVSYGGRLRFRTINAHVVTLASSPYKQEVNVQPAQ